MKKTAAYLFILICWLAGKQALFAQTLSFRNYTVNDGLANSTIYYMHQDSDGFIWFATESGVNRYDGQTFQTFTMDDGLSDNEVLQIHEDSKRRIWFLTLNGKLSYYYKRKFYNSDNSELIKNTYCKASFVSFFEDSKHRLWFSTNQRDLVMIDGSKVKIYSSAKHALTNSFITENKQSEILIISQNRIYKVHENDFLEIKSEFYPISFKTMAYDRRQKTTSYLSKSGLVQLDNDRAVVKQILPEKIFKGGISNFLFDKNKTLWVNTMGNGSYIFDKAASEAPRQVLRGKYVTHSILDDDGNIWISTIGNGVYMLPESAQDIQHYTMSNGLNDNAIYSIVKKPNGELVLGLKNGNINIISGNKVTYKTLQKTFLYYNPVKKLYYDSQNKSIWFASNNALGELNQNESKRYLRERDNLTYSVKSFSISKSGNLAIALAAGVDILKNKNSLLLFETPNLSNLSSHFPSRAYCVFYDSSERLWFSNINGLQYTIDNKHIKLFASIPQLRQRITDITELPDKSIICASYGFGVFILKNEKLIKVITTRNGLSSNICKKVFYADNYLWVVTGKGISRVSNDFNKIDNFQKENGLLSNEINDLIVANDSVYVASNSGLTIFDSKTEQRTQKSVRLHLNYILINNKKIDVSKKLDLPYKSNHLTANFIAIDFNYPKKVSYQYRLKSDLKWSTSFNNTLEFGSLEPGEYRLQIRAKSINSGWSKPIVFEFYVKPPLWKNPWFILLVIAILGPALSVLTHKLYKNKRVKIQETLLAKTKIIALEQQALQAMMNPHFIFNVMNSIQHFITTKDTVMANQLLTGFARLIRKNLEICNKSYISIEEELAYLTLYLSLEKLRFGNKLNYEINIDPQIDKEETLIPSMLLQPFVENAIWHGIMPRETEGNIWIRLTVQNQNLLYICIEDDGVGIENSYKSKNNDHISRGMELTRERITLLNKFDTPIELQVEQTIPSGTKVTISMAI